MPYTLGCCFFGTPTEVDLPVHTTALEPNPYRAPTTPTSYREVDLPVRTRTLEPNPYRKTFKASATLSEVPVAVWAGLAAVAGLSLLLTYRLRRPSLSGLLIRADGTEEVYKPAKKKFTLTELQKAVGGYVERVPVTLPGRKHMLVDEEGLLKRRPLNRKATQLATENGFPSIIVGDVLITEPGEGI